MTYNRHGPFLAYKSDKQTCSVLITNTNSYQERYKEVKQQLKGGDACDIESQIDYTPGEWIPGSDGPSQGTYNLWGYSLKVLQDGVVSCVPHNQKVIKIFSNTIAFHTSQMEYEELVKTYHFMGNPSHSTSTKGLDIRVTLVTILLIVGGLSLSLREPGITIGEPWDMEGMRQYLRQQNDENNNQDIYP